MVDFNRDRESWTHLVLTRKPGESIRIDGPAEVEIVDMHSGRSRISVRAPRTTKILRTEIADKPPTHRPAA